jgi:hypothetical protein
MGIMWSQSRVWGHNSHFLRGTSTDDRSQAVLIFRSIVAAGVVDGADPSRLVDVVEFGRSLTEWLRTGHAEHKHGGGLGRGATTFHTVSNPSFAKDPIAAARAVWERSGRQIAPNASVMQISTSACFAFWDNSGNRLYVFHSYPPILSLIS